MNKKVLIIATVPYMIGQFNIPNIKLLQEIGYEVNVACNFGDRSIWNKKEVCQLKECLQEMQVKMYQIPFERSPLRLGKNFQSYLMLKNILEKKQYEFIHCHTPVGGVVGRVAAKNVRAKVIYTAHGFHFYRGAALINWILYYPVEHICSYMTDVLITINREDFELAQKKMRAKRIVYLPGVGIDTKNNLRQNENVRKILRDKLMLSDKDKLLLSVGELNFNKNHIAVLEAMSKIKSRNVHYAIAGQGKMRDKLIGQAKRLGILERVHLLGFQTNIEEWYEAADIYVFPSYREGLSVSLMEAMKHGLPCLVSDIRGNIDLIQDKTMRFNPYDSAEIGALIDNLLEDKNTQMRAGEINKKNVECYSIENVIRLTRKIYM